MGEFVEIPYTDSKYFEMDYPNTYPEKQKTECPGCKSEIVCQRYQGFGESPVGWCDKCEKGVSVGSVK